MPEKYSIALLAMSESIANVGELRMVRAFIESAFSQFL